MRTRSPWESTIDYHRAHVNVIYNYHTELLLINYSGVKQARGGVVNVLKWRGWPAHYGSFFWPRIIFMGIFFRIPLFLWVYFWGHYFYGSVFERALFFWVKSSSGWPFFACWSWNFIIFMGIFLVKIIFMGRFLLGKLFFSVRVKFPGPVIPVTLVYWLPPPEVIAWWDYHQYITVGT